MTQETKVETPVAPVVETKTAPEPFDTLMDQIVSDPRFEEKAANISKKTFARNAPANFAVPKEEVKTTLGEWLEKITTVNWPTASHQAKEHALNYLIANCEYKELRQKQAQFHGQKTTSLEQSVSGHGLELVPIVYSDSLFTCDGVEPALWGGPGTFTQTSNIEKRASWDMSGSPSNGNQAFGGGFTVAVVSEGTLPTEVAPNTAQITFQADKYMGLFDVSNELLHNNNVGVEEELRRLIGGPSGIIAAMDYGFLNGNGSHITGALAAASAYSFGRQTLNTVTFQDLATIAAHRIPSLKGDYVWLMHPAVGKALYQLSDSANRIIYWRGLDVTGTPQEYLFGMPIVWTDICANLGTDGDVVLMSRASYGIGVNKQVEIAVSPHYKFGYDVITYRVTAYVSGASRFTSTVLDRSAAFTYSPTVYLHTATS